LARLTPDAVAAMAVLTAALTTAPDAAAQPLSKNMSGINRACMPTSYSR
jgi:hypothetical protein